MSFKNYLHELGKDSPLIGLGAAQVAGVSLNTWILWLGFAYGVFRLVSIGLDVYWKIKDRRGKGN